MTVVDIVDCIIDIDDELCITDEVSDVDLPAIDDTDLVIDADDVADKLDDFREDDTMVGKKLVIGTFEVAVATFGIVLCEMLALSEISLNVNAGIIPLTALPKGVIKSRLTAVAVNKYGSEKFRLLKDPSTVSFLPTTGIV